MYRLPGTIQVTSSTLTLKNIFKNEKRNPSAYQRRNKCTCGCTGVHTCIRSIPEGMTEVAGWVKQNRHPVEEGSMEQMGALEKRTSSLRYFGNGVLAKCKAQVIQCLSGVGQRS